MKNRRKKLVANYVKAGKAYEQAWYLYLAALEALKALANKEREDAV